MSDLHVLATLLSSLPAASAASFGLSKLARAFPNSYSRDIRQYLNEEKFSPLVLTGIKADNIRVYKDTYLGKHVLGHADIDYTMKVAREKDQSVTGRFNRMAVTFKNSLMPFFTSQYNTRTPCLTARPEKPDEPDMLYMPKNRDDLFFDIAYLKAPDPQSRAMLNTYVLGHELKHTDHEERDNRLALLDDEGEADLYGLYTVNSAYPLNDFVQNVKMMRAETGMASILFTLLLRGKKWQVPVHETTLIIDAWQKGEEIPSAADIETAVLDLMERMGEIMENAHGCKPNDYNIEETLLLVRACKAADIRNHLDMVALCSENPLAARLVELWSEAEVYFNRKAGPQTQIPQDLPQPA